MQLLLLSNSMNAGQGYLEHARDSIVRLLGPSPRRVAFVPYAAVRFSYDEYADRVRSVFSPLGYEVQSVHEVGTPATAIEAAEALVVGGGNTFHLVREMYAAGIMAPIRERALAGTPYIGWSAGSNVACPTLRTTNDMPIVAPPSFDTLGLVPFQINPHYTNAQPEGHRGETRDERIEEFCAANPGVYVAGLREGSTLQVVNERINLLGSKSLRIFRNDETPREIEPGEDLSFLLSRP